MSCSAYEIQALLPAAVVTEGIQRELEETYPVSWDLVTKNIYFFFFERKLTNDKIVVNNVSTLN